MNTPLSRRKLLETTGATLSVLLSGCSNRSDSHRELDFEQLNRLGGASPVAIESEPVREYEYIAEDDRVRLHYDSGETSTRPFTEWGTMRAAYHAANHIKSLLDAESLMGDGIDVGWGRLDFSEINWTEGDSTPTEDEFSRDADFAPMVSHLHHYDRKGNLISKPDVSFESITEATPRAIDVTMLFPEREYTATLPVLCERTAMQNE